jgi:hypothetical protein
MRPSNLFLPAVALLVAVPASLRAQDAEMKAKMKDAMSAAPAAVSANASLVDRDGTVMREGTNGWTCMPTPSDTDGPAPMCLDAEWMAWAEAWQNKQPVTITAVGIGYMLAGDGGASNTDPYATDPSEVDDWVSAGPHLMVIVPDAADLEGMTDDPENGGPWVMWKGTPYAHIMVPVN